MKNFTQKKKRLAVGSLTVIVSSVALALTIFIGISGKIGDYAPPDIIKLASSGFYTITGKSMGLGDVSVLIDGGGKTATVTRVGNNQYYISYEKVAGSGGGGGGEGSGIPSGEGLPGTFPEKPEPTGTVEVGQPVIPGCMPGKCYNKN